MRIIVAQIRNLRWLEMAAVYLLFRLLISLGLAARLRRAESFILTRKWRHFLLVKNRPSGRHSRQPASPPARRQDSSSGGKPSPLNT